MKNKGPLTGCRVVILRAIEQSHELKKSLQSLGAEVVLCPLLQFEPIVSSLKKITPSFLKKFSTLIFTSANGGKFFIQALKEKQIDINCVLKKYLVAVGPQTAHTLTEYGIIPNRIAKIFNAEGVLALFENHLENENILMPGAFESRDVLPRELRKRRATVTVLNLYKTIFPKINNNVSLKNGDCVFFTSPSTARHFFESSLYQGQDFFSFCIGNITKATVKHYVSDRIIVSKEATAQSLVESLLFLWTKNSHFGM